MHVKTILIITHTVKRKFTCLLQYLEVVAYRTFKVQTIYVSHFFPISAQYAYRIVWGDTQDNNCSAFIIIHQTPEFSTCVFEWPLCNNVLPRFGIPLQHTPDRMLHQHNLQ